MYKKILLPVDGTSVCEKALETGRELAEKFGGELIIFNAQEIIPAVYWVNDPVVVREAPYDPKEFAEEIVSNVAEKFKEVSFPVKTMTEVGDPASAILEVAEKEACDLIIMCTHGMSPTRRFLLGSVTHKVVHHAHIPVLVIR